MAALRRLLSSVPTHWPVAVAVRTEIENQEGPHHCFGVFGQQLFDAHLKGNTEHFEQVFAVVEQLLTTEDSDLENVIVIGMFEAIQNHGGHRAHEFEKYLPPRCLHHWTLLNRWWNTGSVKEPG